MCHPSTTSDDAENKFYEDLQILLETVLRADNLVATGEPSVRVGTGSAAWEGACCLGSCNSNGLHILQSPPAQLIIPSSDT
ncbi:hypothetical protein SprV_0602169800 [Sparganum proliferum]